MEVFIVRDGRSGFFEEGGVPRESVGFFLRGDGEVLGFILDGGGWWRRGRGRWSMGGVETTRDGCG